MKNKLTAVMQTKRIQRWISRPNHQLVAGLVTPSGRCIWVNGIPANNDRAPDSIYETGSITKTFIGLLLAVGEEKGWWTNSDTLADLVPEWSSSPFAQKTTLLDLATHTSGLPRVPPNMKKTIQDQLDPYANYEEKDLTEAVLSESPREKKAFQYSNYGYGLLGWLLARQLGKSLHNAMTELVFKPLQMNSTGFDVDDMERKIPVYSSKGKPVPHWNFHDCTAGAGGICSTISDMLHYIEANLGLRGKEMAPAFARCHEEYFSIRPDKGIGIGYGWLHFREKDGSLTHWHNGGTYGSSSFASFNRDHGFGLVLLSNYGPNLRSHLPVIGKRPLNLDKIAKLLNEAMLT